MSGRVLAQNASRSDRQRRGECLNWNTMADLLAELTVMADSSNGAAADGAIEKSRMPESAMWYRRRQWDRW